MACRYLNELSATIPAMDGSLSAWLIAVAAPILLPHRPRVDTRLPQERRWSTAAATSSLSKCPRETYSPSERPDPAVVVVVAVAVTVAVVVVVVAVAV